MTLILTRASYRMIIQVSDRAVTVSEKPYDLLSNKALLCLMPNAFISMAYTGPAYIRDIPTDQWIAQTISGVSYDDPTRPHALAIGDVGCRVQIGIMLQQLKHEIESMIASADRNTRSSWKSNFFAIVVDGWQWNSKGHYRPVLYRLVNQQGSCTLQLEMVPRNWYIGRRLKVIASPRGHLKDSEFDQLANDIRSTPPTASIEKMAASIQEVSKRSSLVGSHSVGILILPPLRRYARIHYIPGISNPNEMPIAYSPWVIGPGYVHAPSQIVGDYSDHIGTWSIEFEHPFKALRGGFVGGQERKGPP